MASSAPTPSRVRLPVKDPRLEELLLWRDPKRSAIVLGASTVGFLVLQFAKVNVIQWSAYLVLVAVLGCFLWNNLASFTHRPPVTVPLVFKEGISEGQAKAYAEKATAYINKGLAYANRLATGREPMLSGTVVGIAYLVGRLAGIFSLVGLAYGAALAAFTLPKVYELKKDEIDGAINKLRTQATGLYDKHLHKYASKIPRYTAAKPAESSSDRKEE